MLERRAMLAVTVLQDPDTNIVTILYNQPDAFGFTATSNQNVIVEIEDSFFPFVQTRVNVYVPSNPTSINTTTNLNPPPPFSTAVVDPQPSYSFLAVPKVSVQVPNYDGTGVNNNSLTIKGIGETTDRIIIAGSGRTASGRWSDETVDEDQVLLDISGIDDLTVTAGGIINVSGVFSNDTLDASIHAIATIPEDSVDQLAGTVVVGETTPVSGTLPHPRVEANYVEIVGAELDILSDIVATDHVILRAGENAPVDARSNLVLPYDVTITGNATTGAGVLELFSTQNIVQLASSTLQSRHLVAASDNANVATSNGPWMISLGSIGNDFDTIALGMTSAQGDTAVAATAGRIGVRDVDDLTVSDFGILASAGQVRLEAAGALAFAAPVQATGLIGRSNDSITTAAAAVMTLGGLGIDLAAGDTFDPGVSTGDVTLNGEVTVQAAVAGTLVSNSVQGVGTVTVAGRFRSPDAGSTKFVSTGTTPGAQNGVVVSGPVQVGGTTFNAAGTAVTVTTHDLSLISHGGTVAVNNVPGNNALPYAIQATNIVDVEAAGAVTIAGSVFAGSIYGNPAALAATVALPSITVRGGLDEASTVTVTGTGSLRTVAYNTNPAGTDNPLVGAISIVDATAVSIGGAISADGAVYIGGLAGVSGDVEVIAGGSVTGRENVVIHSSTGSVSVQGRIASTGGTYAAAPAAGSQRNPNVVINAPEGGISSSGAGTITSGTVTVGGVASGYGAVTLSAQQDVVVGAAVITTGGNIDISSQFGTFDLSALLQTVQPVNVQVAVVPVVTISTGLGMVESDVNLARIVTPVLNLTNTGAGDLPVTDPLYAPSHIDLGAKNNQIKDVVTPTNRGTVTATNFSVGGGVRIVNNADLQIGNAGITAQADAAMPSTVSLAVFGGLTQAGAINANNLSVSNVGAAAIVLTNAKNDIDNFAATNPKGAVSFTDVDGFETGVNRVAPLGVEVRGTAVTLASVEPYSTIRVVSGLAYNSLSIAAGTQSGTTVGTVEFVPTSTDDNAAPAGAVPTFAGTLRDMIRYVNDNTAAYVANQTARSQPMAVVFDEDGYPVDTITVAAALPTFNRAVSFDGGRLEQNLLLGGQTRLNVTQVAGPSLPYGLSFAPAIAAVPGKAPAYPGSAGSSIQHVAMYGFTKGSALVLGSGNNTVTDFYAGLKADGTVDATTQNLVGLDVTGIAAAANRIGTTVVDPATVNRFGGNTSAGVLIRNGASGNRVFGSVIGDDTGVTPALANGDGIRISAATGNLIGTPDAVQPDQTDSVSNVIAGNKGSGVSIVNATAGTLAAANMVRNSLVARNKVGVAISGSRFAVLGGSDGESGNAIVSQTADGVTIANSLDVQVLGNRIGIVPATDLVPEALGGNGGNGVAITGASQRVQIASGNRISANTLNGVSIGTGATSVTITGNTIGGQLDDGIDPPTSAGNGRDGVFIKSAIGNTVGAGNTISYNVGNGVSMTDARAATLAVGNRILGSTIANNTAYGVYVGGGSASTVGGTAAGDGNVITANGGAGIYLERVTATGAPSGYAIQGNFVGTNTNRDVDASLGNLGGGLVLNDANGTRIEANTVMNNLQGLDTSGDVNDGITLRGGSGNVVGGLSAAVGNRVTNNERDGIRVVGSAVTRPATGHWITGNTIADNGSTIADNGVTVTGAFARSITVGQSVTTAGVRGLGNAIQRNAGYGVAVTGGAQQVAIQGNSIADNGRGGIFIAAGSNESTASAAPPIRLDAATIRRPAGSQMQILLQGALSGVTKGQQYSIDVYANAPPFGVGFPPSSTAPVQARRYLGRITVTATADGTLTWGAKNPLVISANVSVGEYITASVTALRVQPGSTSALSVGRIAR